MSRTRHTTLSAADIELFGRISGDLNPIHLDDAYAATTMFKGRIAHGMLTASLISAVIGQDLPGKGTVYLKQDLEFLAPVRPGDRIEATVTVFEVSRERRRVTLDCACRVAGAVVLRGRALVIAPARP
ncbi:MaoC family dehydratase [Paracoccus sp. (in: a-proteobacteria)]|uniref:MaoC family dehydratase n=1 Tax=Paracoccus sp. TaxID=267 RepID=UPI0032204EE2